MKGKIQQKLFRVSMDEEAYFNRYCDDIISHNLKILNIACNIQLFMIVVYFITAVFTFHSMRINSIYFVYVVCYVFMALYIFRYESNGICKPQIVQTMCWIFNVCCMAFIITISVYPLTDDPSIFFLIMIVLLPILFIFPMKQKLLFVMTSEIIFLVLAWFIKTENVVCVDLVSSLIACFISIFVVFYSCNLRLRDNAARVHTRYQTNIDILTGLPGRESTEYLSRIYLRQLHSSKRCALFLLALDGIREIREQYGYHQGDYVLHEFSSQLKRILHPYDIAGRLGTSSFLLLIKDVNNRSILDVKAEQINELARNIKVQNQTGLVTCSIGIAASNGSGMPSYTELYEFADQALYRSKMEKKNGFVILDVVSETKLDEM